MTRPAPLDYRSPTLAVAPAARSLAMASIGRGVATVGIAVWLGSLVHLLLTVATLFRAFPKQTSRVAVDAAPAVFAASESVGLFVAAVTLLAAIAWHAASPTRARRWLAWLLAAAAVLAVAQRTVVSARMDALRAAGASASGQFKSLHAVSSTQYLAQTGLLLACAIALPAAIRRDPVGSVTP